MIFRQIFDKKSHTYTYLIASRPGAEAVLIDPVRELTDSYLKLIEELDLRLVMGIDTHTHADHLSALGRLRYEPECIAVMGGQSRAECIDRRVDDGEVIDVDGLKLIALHTPGHTDDSYSFVIEDEGPGCVMTGDTLLIRGTGRTDFQNGSADAQYDSLFHGLLHLPEAMRVYPAHDYNGMSVSTIGEEKRFNPRLQVDSRSEYVALMESLDLSPPELMDIAVPANLHCGSPPSIALADAQRI